MEKDREQKEMVEMMQYVANTVGDLVEQFSEMDTKISQMDTKISQMDTKISQMVTKDEFNERVNSIYNMLDKDVQRTTDNEMETTAIHHKLDRHEGWIELLARKVGVALKS